MKRESSVDKLTTNTTGMSKKKAAGWATAMLVIQLSVISASPQSQPDPGANHTQRAHQFIAQGKTQAAIAEYEAAIAVDPANKEAQGNLGVLQFFGNDCPDALPHLKEALNLQTSQTGESEARIQALAGICQKRAGELEDAERNLSASLPQVQNPKIHTLILSNLVDLEYAKGDVQRASQSVGELMKSDPDNPDVLYLAYRIYSDLAVSARNQLTILGPDSARMHLLMAEEFIKSGDATRAVHQYELALQKDASLMGVHFELGEAILSESLGEDSLKRAYTELELALKQDPRNAGAEGKLGVVEGLRGNTALAEQHYNRALSLKSDQLDALLGLGGIFRERGDNQKAAEFYARAEQASPMDESIYLRLAQTYRSLNRKAEADQEMKLFEQIKSLKNKSSLAQVRRTDP